MLDETLKIAVVGAGAIGGIVAGILSDAGYDVEIVSKYREVNEPDNIKNVHVFGVCGEYYEAVKSVLSVKDLTEKKDMVFIATKANDCFDAAKELLPYLHEDSAVVSLQNGICEDGLAKILGEERTIGCVVEWSATMHEGGNYEMTDGGEFIIGRMDREEDSRLKKIKEILDNILPTRISQNMTGELYSKLIINACINSLSVVVGKIPGEFVWSKAIRRVFIKIIEEAMVVADKLNINVEPRGGGKLNYYYFISGNSIFSALKRHIMVFAIGMKIRKITPSSLQSIWKGNKTETDFFNGYISRKGKEFNAPTPYNDEILKVIGDIENGRPVSLQTLGL